MTTMPQPPPHPAVTGDEHRALSLEVREENGFIEVQLVGLSQHELRVGYLIEIKGASTSLHRGTTLLAPGTRVVLSTIRTSYAPGWTVTLRAQEDGRGSYAITRGPYPPRG